MALFDMKVNVPSAENYRNLWKTLYVIVAYAPLFWACGIQAAFFKKLAPGGSFFFQFSYTISKYRCRTPAKGRLLRPLQEGKGVMIEVHRLNGELFLLNSDMIETIDATPDTVVRLLNGHRYIVRETMRELYDKVVAFRKRAGYTCIVANSADESQDSEEL